jgi:hypothetical protein
VQIDAGRKPLRIGTTITKGLLTNFPNQVKQYSLTLPQVTVDSLFDHVLFDWNPFGHLPNMYSLPHFDFHFVIVSQQERDAIPFGWDPVPV